MDIISDHLMSGLKETIMYFPSVPGHHLAGGALQCTVPHGHLHVTRSVQCGARGGVAFLEVVEIRTVAYGGATFSLGRVLSQLSAK